MPSMSPRLDRASARPLDFPSGRSTCVTSPVTTARDPRPMRVRNIRICSRVVFCASSKITNESESVRPRMNASGATSIVPRPMRPRARSISIMSPSASKSGRKYGFTFSAKSPGKKPNFSPASTAGRVSTMRLYWRVRSAETAHAIAKYVFPVPAGPIPNVMS